nr:MAG TPA: Radical SAM superfamily [Caudoviricetes sp.]
MACTTATISLAGICLESRSSLNSSATVAPPHLLTSHRAVGKLTVGKHLPEVVPDAAGRPLFSFRGNHRLRPGHYCSRKAGKSGNMPFFQLPSFCGSACASGCGFCVQRFAPTWLPKYSVDQIQRRCGEVVPYKIRNLRRVDMYFVHQLAFLGWRKPCDLHRNLLSPISSKLLNFNGKKISRNVGIANLQQRTGLGNLRLLKRYFAVELQRKTALRHSHRAGKASLRSKLFGDATQELAVIVRHFYPPFSLFKSSISLNLSLEYHTP